MKKRIIYIVEDSKSIQYRYRVKNLLEIMDLSEKWTMEVFSKQSIEIGDMINSQLIVIERQTSKDNKLQSLIRKASSLNIKVLFDIDDLVFDYQDLKLVVDTVGGKNMLYWFGYFFGIRRIAKMVDGFLCTNDFLGQKLMRSFGKPYRVIPNSLNRKQVEVSRTYLKKKRHKGFIVGYFSGSPTHAKDFSVAESEIIEFLKKHKDAKLKVVGYMDFSEEMKKMVGIGKVDVLSLVDYLKLQELMAGVDVNIAPLVINDFTNCKSELKFFEAAVVEITTVASPTYAFRHAIEDGRNGFLAKSGEWYNKLEYLYMHPKENERIAKRAKEYVLSHYYGERFLRNVEEAYDYFCDECD